MPSLSAGSVAAVEASRSPAAAAAIVAARHAARERLLLPGGALLDAAAMLSARPARPLTAKRLPASTLTHSPVATASPERASGECQESNRTPPAPSSCSIKSKPSLLAGTSRAPLCLMLADRTPEDDEPRDAELYEAAVTVRRREGPTAAAISDPRLRCAGVGSVCVSLWGERAGSRCAAASSIDAAAAQRSDPGCVSEGERAKPSQPVRSDVNIATLTSIVEAKYKLI